MSWIVVATAAGTALMGAMTADEQRRAQQKSTEGANSMNAKINAAQTEFSPWTKATPTAFSANAVAPGPSDLGGAIQGGLGGAMFAKNMQQQKAEMELLQAQIDAANRGAVPPSITWSGNSRGGGSGNMNG